MKKRFMKLFTVVTMIALLVVSAFGIMACGNNSSRVKIGVLVADGSGAEAMAFRHYYEDYVQENYEVDFVYSAQLDDAADELAAIERFAAENCKAVISFSSYDRPGQIEACEDNKLYYAVATGMLSAEDFEKYKSNPYFLGQIGPDTTTEYNVGLAMGTHFKEAGVDDVALYVGFPAPEHVYRTAGILTGLGLKYSGTTGDVSGQDIAGMIYYLDEGTANIKHIVTGDSGIYVRQVLSGAGFGGPLDGQVTTLIAGTHPDVVLGVGMVSVFFANQLDTNDIPYSDVDAFTSDNQKHFVSGDMQYLAGKYGSSVGPVFALVYNAINGNVIRDNGKAVSISQDYLVATSVAEYNEAYNKETGSSPIFNKAELETVIGDSITFETFRDFVVRDR